MKRYTTRLIAFLGALTASATAMAHGGHEHTDSTVVHTLYHLIVANRLPVLLAIGMLVIVVFGRTALIEAVRRIIERK